MPRPPIPDLYQCDQGRPPLTADEERELFAKRRTATPEERLQIDDRIVRANMGFAAREALAMGRRGSYESMRRAAVRGLFTAVTRFDETRGWKFITYAVHWIRQAMLAELAAQNRWVKFPTTLAASMHRIYQAGVDDQSLVTLEDRMAAAGLTELQREDVRTSAVGPVYLDDRNSLTDGQKPIGDAIPTPEAHEDDGWCGAMDDPPATIRTALEALEDRERWIIVRYYGLEGKEPLTMEQIGREFGVTRERVRQIKERAEAALRRAMLESDCGDLRAEFAALLRRRQTVAQDVGTTTRRAEM